MPLPPALLKKLASRGLIDPNAKHDKNKNSSTRKPQPAAIIQDTDNNNELPFNEENNEEIIAEDYDEIEEDPLHFHNYEPVKKPQENFWIERMKKRLVEGGGVGYKSCPNKYNIFHKCTLYCINRWGDGILEPKQEYVKRQKRLLKKYPLPKNWVEVYDHGCGVHYYWNTVDENVSWLPPNHPNTQISKSAAALRRELEEIQGNADDDEENSIGAENGKDSIDRIINEMMKRTVSPPPLEDSSTFPPLKKPKPRDLDKAIKQKSRNKNKLYKNSDLNPLDPMDPASYSDIPRGKWSDGLVTSDGSKSGVDPTASGALFQMRPYPSPGAVLQANASATSVNKSLTKSKSNKTKSHHRSSSESEED